MPIKYLNRNNSSTTISAGNSVLFNGSNQYLSIPSNSAFNFGTGNYTVEGWFYWTSVPANARPFTNGQSAGSFQFYWDGGTYTSNKLIISNRIANQLQVSFLPVVNTWYHIAAVRNSGTVSIYVNGTSLGSIADSNNYSTSAVFNICGDVGNGGTWFFPGYISNLRVVNGTAVYTASFTPPTSPLTAIANTSLLTCKSATIVDNSTNNFTITNNGAATVSSTVPFTASFVPAPRGIKFLNRSNSGTATATGKSVQFNGSNQYLSLPNTSVLNLGSNNFTMEAFVYIPNVSGNKNIFYINGNASSYSAICLYVQDSRFAFLANQTGGYPWTLQIGAVGPTISSNTWYHVAATRSGNSFYVFVNGTLVSGAPYSLSGALYNGTTNIIGYQPTVPSYFNGYITNARIINGTALYTASFTAPTSPLTAIANTSLLTCNAATIIDGSSNNLTITNNNSATVSSTTPFTVATATSTMKMRKVFADAATLVTSGLVLNLDASNASSYPSSGTSWFDLSGNGNNGTLYNGPTFNSANGGSIVFDGSNDYVTLGTSIPTNLRLGQGNFTIDFWVYPNGTGTYSICGNLNDADGGGSYWVIINSTYTGLHTVQFGYAGLLNVGAGYKFGTTALPINVWSNVILSRIGTTMTCYINGSSYATPITVNNFTGNFNIDYLIGMSKFGSGFTSYPLNGRLAILRIYNGMGFTQSEVLQNYNANRAKFGL